MHKLIELKKDENILVSSQIEKFLKPDFIYIPIGNNEKIHVHKNDHILIGDILVSNGLISPVSGVVKQIRKMDSAQDGEYFLEIENDFLESRKKNAGVREKITKEEVLKVFRGLEGKKNFVLNAIDDEIYVLTENFYLFLYYDVFLELLDDLNGLFMFDNIYVCVKASSSENINKLMSELGMYPNIELKIVPDLYLLGRKEFLLSYLGLVSEDAYVLSSSMFFAYYNALKRSRVTTDKLITISGNGIHNPMVVQVKIGSKLNDVVHELVEMDEDVLFIANGLMSGKVIDLENFVVTSSLHSLLIMKKEEKMKSGECINCGACMDICPVGLNPLLLHLEKVKEKCINCGLCSYICPVYIDFRRDYIE